MTSTPSKQKKYLAAIHFPEGELLSLSQKLESSWRIAVWDAGTLDGIIERPEDTLPDCILVYAHPHKDATTLDLFRNIAQRPEFKNLPLLAYLSAYQATLGSELTRLPNSSFLFDSFEEPELEEKIRMLKKYTLNPQASVHRELDA